MIDKYLGKQEVIASAEFSIDKINLTNGLILCRKILVENKTKAGIIMPTGKSQDVKDVSNFYRVIKIDTHDTEIAKSIQVKPGDIVNINGGYDVVRGGIELVECKQGNILEYYTDL